MGSKKKKKSPPPAGPKGAPEWVVTFTDMVSLLVTFFVLMMTFSSLREDELLKMPSWMQKLAGFHEVKGNSAVSPELDQLTAMDLVRGKPQPHSRPADQLDEDVVEMQDRQLPAGVRHQRNPRSAITTPCQRISAA